jgi:oligopeptide transport system ATP-binding protein
VATLAIDGLSVQFGRGHQRIAAVRDVSLTVAPGECVGIVGESGSGKTQTFMAAMGLLPAHASVSGSVRFEGEEILGADPGILNRVRGSQLTMIFQDPMSSLTPHLRIGMQMAETLVCHAHLSWRAAERAALEMLERVRVPEAARRMRQYPHELSGGMRQRVMIGMSLLCEPKLLIADEPTTALDVTVQAQIIELLRAMRHELLMGVVLISHDLGVVAGLADRIVVMYAGRVVEAGESREILHHARHPYTTELLKCVPDLWGPQLDRMPSLAGVPPNPASLERGCAFAPRCSRATPRCRDERPLLAEAPGDALIRAPGSAHRVACHHPGLA